MEKYERLYDKWHIKHKNSIKKDKIIFPKIDLNAPILRYSKFHLFSLYLLDLLSNFRKKKHANTILFLIFVILLLFFEFKANALAVFLAFISVLLFYPMSHYDYLGLELSFSAMIILSSMYGFTTGIIMGKIPNIIGHLITHKIDFEFIYELIVFVPIAYISSLVSLEHIIPVGIVISVIYNIGYMLFFIYSGLFTMKRLIYAISHCLFSIGVIVNLVPLLA